MTDLNPEDAAHFVALADVELIPAMTRYFEKATTPSLKAIYAANLTAAIASMAQPAKVNGKSKKKPSKPRVRKAVVATPKAKLPPLDEDEDDDRGQSF